MEWKKLTARTMPPVDNRKRVLLWLGANEDGGFPVIAARVKYNNDPPYIRYSTCNGWKVLENQRGVMWAEIEVPEQAKAKLAEWQKIRQRLAEALGMTEERKAG